MHKTGRGDKIKPQPVMEVIVKKTKLDAKDSRTPHETGTKCLLYEARKVVRPQTESEITLKAKLQEINPSMGLCQVMSPGTSSMYKDTKFGKAPSGSFCSYQLQFTEANFSVCCDLTSIPRTQNNVVINIMQMEYPAFPLQKTNEFQKPGDLDENQENLFNHLVVDEAKLNKIEKETREQSSSNEWKTERRFRLTASNFQTIGRRKRNFDTLTNNLLNPKEVNNRYTLHGNKYEQIALQQYEKYMFATRNRVKVFKSGLVVSMELPFIGASPDGKVVDVGCVEQFGLVEVKCPFTKFLVTPVEACSDDKFCAELVDGKPTLKRNHMYYHQVQGQLGVTRASWCDFVIYTSMGMNIERIEFDPLFWSTLAGNLKSYFFDHFLNAAALEFRKQDDQRSI